ncbi:bifunctional diguanylate cyclase/phosphodiesterase [Mangrovitalea sediminis]|uniref:bifunctional diguanylate cyclase/phosphodiesterase n=1 Tax=Mangrovitalea sediminis TaxID=1982043 RepID=UPI000BE5897D|nr:EAL domain-containing protein [Mangrovitalea sediminis]
MSIRVKLLFWLSLVSVLMTASMGYISFNNSRQLVIKRFTDELSAATRSMSSRYQAAMGGVTNDLMVLSHLSNLRRLYEKEGQAQANAKNDLAVVFTDFMRVHPEYLQMRFIEYQHFGREVVRVDRKGNELVRITGNRLQEKGYYPYVYQTKLLKPGDFFFSGINLKQENSYALRPNSPSFKAALPVFDENNKPYGVLVINVALDTLFTALKNDTARDALLYLANHEGDVLIDPDPKKTFGFDVGRRYLLQNDFPQLAGFFKNNRENLSINDPGTLQKAGYLASFTRIPMGPMSDRQFLVLGISIPYDNVLSITQQLQRKTLELFAMFALMAVVFSFFISRFLTAPLNQVIHAISHADENLRSTFPLPVRQRDEIGLLARTYASMSARIASQVEALRDKEKNLNELLEAAPSMIVIIDWETDEVLFMNNRAKAKFAHASPGGVVNPLQSFETHATAQRIRKTLEAQKVLFDQETRLYDSEGSPFWLLFSAIHTQYQDRPAILMSSTDITEQKRNEQRITQLAFYDPLTNLPNRRLLLDRLNHEIALAHREDKYGAVLFMDLDRFKVLNDSYGHHLGDELLIQVANRILSVVRAEDTAARLGGDEFVVIVHGNAATPEEAADESLVVAKKIMEVLSSPFDLGHTRHHTTPSMGIALYPVGNLPAGDYIQQADTAMYMAKDRGGNTLNFFQPSMQESANKRLQLEKELRTALEEDQFCLYYQPQVDDTGRVIGVEALVRWNHPERGIVSPAHFIDLAEETGLIIPIGSKVLEKVCHQIKQWESAGIRLNHVSVNVSSKQLRQPEFTEQIEDILKATSVEPDRLMIELTERVVIDDLDDTIRKMLALQRMGIGISIDDFGTGYSSLSYLKKLPLKQLKIDQSFVRDITTDPNDAVIVYTIIQMAKSLGLDVIAEGVETEEQLRFLKEKGCTAYQGYFFGRPSPDGGLGQHPRPHSNPDPVTSPATAAGVSRPAQS